MLAVLSSQRVQFRRLSSQRSKNRTRPGYPRGLDRTKLIGRRKSLSLGAFMNVGQASGNGILLDIAALANLPSLHQKRPTVTVATPPHRAQSGFSQCLMRFRTPLNNSNRCGVPTGARILELRAV